MLIQQFLCPRVRLTKKDGGRLILPIDAISGIEEDNREKCVRVCTMDGFWYNVVNQIVEIDKKIEDAIARDNAKIPIVISDTTPIATLASNPSILKSKQDIVIPHENTKATRIKKKRMLSAGVDKPARRIAEATKDYAEGTVAIAQDEADATNQKT